MESAGKANQRAFGITSDWPLKIHLCSDWLEHGAQVIKVGVRKTINCKHELLLEIIANIGVNENITNMSV